MLLIHPQPDRVQRLRLTPEAWLLYAHPTRRHAGGVATDPLERLHGTQAPPGERYVAVFTERSEAETYAVALRSIGRAAYAAPVARGALPGLLDGLRAAGCGFVVIDPQLRSGQPAHGDPVGDVLAALAGGPRPDGAARGHGMCDSDGRQAGPDTGERASGPGGAS